MPLGEHRLPSWHSAIVTMVAEDPVLRICKHRLGPRVYVMGARVHEWHLGAALLLALAAGVVADRIDESLPAGLLGVTGIWLIAKDWRDLSPSRRDTAAWRLGVHIRPAPLRAIRRADPLPKLAALAAGLAGLVNPRLGRDTEHPLAQSPASPVRAVRALACHTRA